MSNRTGTSQGLKKKKIAASAIAVALAAALMIGGTFSYLQSSSETVTNSFATNGVDVSIEESGDGQYNIIPGTSEEKDPTVVVSASVDTYVFLIVEDNTYGLVEYEIDETVWTKLVIEDCPICSELYSCSEDCTCIPLELEIWYAVVDASDDDVKLNVLTDQTVSYSKTLTNEDMTGYADDDNDSEEGTTESETEEETEEETDPEITLSFSAFAIQQDAFEIYDLEGIIDHESSAIQALLCSDYYYGLLEDAGWTLVSTAEELTKALETGGNIAVTADISIVPTIDNGDETRNVNSSFVVTKDTVLYLGNNTLSFDTSDIEEEDFADYVSLLTVNNATVTIMGGTVDASAGENNSYALTVYNGGNVTINCGTYIGTGEVIYVYAGTLTVNCGYFSFSDAHKNVFGVNPDYYYYYYYWNGFMLNCYDTNRSNGTASITVKGGTFNVWNPASNHAEGTNTNFVAEGYTSTQSGTLSDGSVNWTVSKSSDEEATE